jgi:hypothetical protein
MYSRICVVKEGMHHRGGGFKGGNKIGLKLMRGHNIHQIGFPHLSL